MSFNLGILSGIGERSRQHQEEEYKNNASMLENATNLYTHLLSMPNISPEGLQHATTSLLTLATTNPHDPKAVKNAVKQTSDVTPFTQGLQPQTGGSWMGGQTSRPVTAENFAIPSMLKEANAGPNLNEVQGGSVPSLDQGPSTPTTIPPAETYSIPNPAPPAVARTPYFKTSAQLASESDRALRSRYAAEYGARAEFETPKVNEFNPTQGLYQTDAKGNTKILREPGSPTRHYELKTGTVNGKAVNANYDPATGRTYDLSGTDISGSFLPKEATKSADERYAELYTKVQNGTATPQEQTELKGIERLKTLTTTTRFNLYNPSAPDTHISEIADIAEQRGLDSALKLVRGVTETNQLVDELGRRGSNVFKSFADLQKVTGQSATFQNFHSNVSEVRRLLPTIQRDPTLTSLALADPDSTLGQQLKGKVVNGQLDKEQLNLVYAIRNLREDLFGLRQFFGNSPVRSNAQVQIMLAQIPDESLLTTGDPAKINIALQQLERSVAPIEKQFGNINTIKRTVPNVPSPTGGPGNNAGSLQLVPGGAVDRLIQGQRGVR